jgi:hypothetical protein
MPTSQYPMPPDASKAERELIRRAYIARFKALFRDSLDETTDDEVADVRASILGPIREADAPGADVLSPEERERVETRFTIAYVRAKLRESGLPPIVIEPTSGQPMEKHEGDVMALPAPGTVQPFAVRMKPGESAEDAMRRGLAEIFGPDAKIEISKHDGSGAVDGEITLLRRDRPSDNDNNPGGLR